MLGARKAGPPTSGRREQSLEFLDVRACLRELGPVPVPRGAAEGAEALASSAASLLRCGPAGSCRGSRPVGAVPAAQPHARCDTQETDGLLAWATLQRQEGQPQPMTVASVWVAVGASLQASPQQQWPDGSPAPPERARGPPPSTSLGLTLPRVAAWSLGFWCHRQSPQWAGREEASCAFVGHPGTRKPSRSPPVPPTPGESPTSFQGLPSVLQP